MNHRIAMFCLASALTTVACMDQGPGGGGSATGFTKVAGDRQVAFPLQILSVPLAVRVADSNGVGLSGLNVSWTSAVGAPSNPATMTDADGLASVFFTLGSTVRPDTIIARVTGRTDSLIFVEYAVTSPSIASQTAVPSNYGIHDTFVRDGIAFACVWNTGVIVFDVGDGRAGGTPSAPVPLDTILTGSGSLPSGRQAHNAWWFHNPVSNEKRYLFVGQEGPGIIGSSSSGDIHVVDVSNLANGTEVAFYHMPNVSGQTAGPHNFWMDESAQILYAAYYNGGVVALDVSGTLSGDLGTREIAKFRPGGAGNTYVWSIQLVGTSLYAVDMLSGVWQLSRSGATFSVAGGGNNVPERYSSDFWVYGNHIYSGSWNSRDSIGDALKIWRLNAQGAPQLVDSVITPGIATVSDVQVTNDGKLLVISSEGGPSAGLYVFDLTNPEKPVPVGRSGVLSLHTATIADINGHRYVFAAKNPASPAMVVFDITSLAP